MKTPLLFWTVLLLLVAVSVSDGSDGLHVYHGSVHHDLGHHHGVHHHGQTRHSRQRRQGVQKHLDHEWSPSRAIKDNKKSGKGTSKIKFGIGQASATDLGSDWVFLSKNATTVRAHIGSTAVLPCQVKKDSQYGMITWARLRDEFRPYSVLTIGDQNYVEDKRFFVSKPQQSPHLGWALRIKKVTPEDAGRYECQATTHPPQYIVTRLKVVEAFSQILGTKEKIIKSGSTLQLHCVLKRATEEPLYIFWYHNDRMINYDSYRGVSVTKDVSGSTLTLNSATQADSGNYTCSPYNIRPSSVMVHVLSEGNSAAAVQNSDNSKSSIDGSTSTKGSSSSDRAAPPSAAVQSSSASAYRLTSQQLLSTLITTLTIWYCAAT